MSPSEYYQILQARKLKKVDNEPNLDFASLTTKNEDLRQSNQFIVSEHNLSQSVEHLKIADEDSSGQEDKETTKSNKSAANSANGKTLGNKRVHKFRKPLIQSASENIILQENRIDLQSTKTDLTLANSSEIFEKSFNQSENSSNKVSLESSTSTTTHRKLKRGTNSILPDTEFKVPKPKVDKVQIDSKRTARDTRQATKLNGRSKNQQSIDDLNSNPPEKKSENEILPVDENSKSIKEITPNNYKPTKDSAKSVLENRSMNAADKIEQPKEKRLKLQLEKLSIKDEFELKEDSAIATKLSENIEQPEVLSIPEDVEVKEVEEDSIVVANLSQSVVKLERHTDLTKPKREDRRRSLPTKVREGFEADFLGFSRESIERTLQHPLYKNCTVNRNTETRNDPTVKLHQIPKQFLIDSNEYVKWQPFVKLTRINNVIEQNFNNYVYKITSLRNLVNARNLKISIFYRYRTWTSSQLSKK